MSAGVGGGGGCSKGAGGDSPTPQLGWASRACLPLHLNHTQVVRMTAFIGSWGLALSDEHIRNGLKMTTQTLPGTVPCPARLRQYCIPSCQVPPRTHPPKHVCLTWVVPPVGLQGLFLLRQSSFAFWFRASSQGLRTTAAHSLTPQGQTSSDCGSWPFPTFSYLCSEPGETPATSRYKAQKIQLFLYLLI